MALNVRSLRVVGVLLLCGWFVACGGEEGSADNGDNQQNTNANQQDNDGQNDGNDDRNDDFIDDPQDGCQETIDRAATFEVPLPDGAETGIVPDVTRVGDELWVTYLADIDVGEETASKGHMVRMECNGEPIDGPLQLGNDVEFDDSPPALDTDGSIVYVVWSDGVETDDGAVARLQGMTFDTDGTARSDEPFSIEFEIDGEMVGELGGPDVAVDHQGNAGVVAVESAGFSSYALFQRIDDRGEPVGGGFYFDEDGDGETGPTITRRDDNHLFFAYTAETVMHGTIRPDGEAVDEGPEGAEPAVGSGNDPGAVAVSKNGAGGNTWMAYTLGATTNNTAKVRTGTFVGLRDGESTSIDERYSQLVAVTASDNGGAKAWASAEGDQGTIHFRRFQGGGLDTSHAGPVIDEHDEDLAIGGPDIVWLADEIFVAVWPEEDGLVGRTLDFDREEE